MNYRPYTTITACFLGIVAFFTLFGLIVTVKTAQESAMLIRTTYLDMYKDNVVMIDAGHGGIDGGAVGKSGLQEKEVNLYVSIKLKHLLNLFGTEVDMTRTEDISLNSNGDTIAKKKVQDMHKRLELINAKPYDVLLSIHMNSYPEEKYWGSQVFYSTSLVNSKKYATSIQTSLREFVAPENKREAKSAPPEIYLLKHATCPALIVECGFLTNYSEEAKLKTENHQIKLASAITAGYLNCYHDLLNNQ